MALRFSGETVSLMPKVELLGFAYTYGAVYSRYHGRCELPVAEPEKSL